MYMSGVNCIYADKTVISMEVGPCQPLLDSGAALVDMNSSATDITVTTTLPSSVPWLALLSIAGVLFGGSYVHGRKRRRH